MMPLRVSQHRADVGQGHVERERKFGKRHYLDIELKYPLRQTLSIGK